MSLVQAVNLWSGGISKPSLGGRMEASLAAKLVGFLRNPEVGFDALAAAAFNHGVPREIAVFHPIRLVLRFLPERSAFHLARRFKYHDPDSTQEYRWPLAIDDLVGEPTENDREKARIPHGGWPVGTPKHPHVAGWASGWQHAVYASERGLACAYVSNKRCCYEADCFARQQRERQWQMQITIDVIQLLAANARGS